MKQNAIEILYEEIHKYSPFNELGDRPRAEALYTRLAALCEFPEEEIRDLLSCSWIEEDGRSKGNMQQFREMQRVFAALKRLWPLSGEDTKPEYDFSQGKRGAIVPTDRTEIVLRLDNDIIDWFRGRAESRGGGNYQDEINSVLRDHVFDKKTEVDWGLSEEPEHTAKAEIDKPGDNILEQLEEGEHLPLIKGKRYRLSGISDKPIEFIAENAVRLVQVGDIEYYGEDNDFSLEILVNTKTGKTKIKNAKRPKAMKDDKWHHVIVNFNKKVEPTAGVCSKCGGRKGRKHFAAPGGSRTVFIDCPQCSGTGEDRRKGEERRAKGTEYDGRRNYSNPIRRNKQRRTEPDRRKVGAEKRKRAL